MEREFIHKLEANKYNGARVAGSGAAPIPLPDIIAGKKEATIPLEHKYGDSPLYIGKGEVRQLIYFTNYWKASEPWIAARFKGDTAHYLAKPHWLPTTEKSYVFNERHVQEDKIRYKSFDQVFPPRETEQFTEEHRRKRRERLQSQ